MLPSDFPRLKRESTISITPVLMKNEQGMTRTNFIDEADDFSTLYDG
jgi:hypothetical protein